MDEQNANSLLNIQINLQEYPGGMAGHPFKNLKPVIVLIQHVEFTVLFGSNRFQYQNFLMNAKAWAAVAPLCTNWKMKVSFDE
jgi:hypothetical protein